MYTSIRIFYSCISMKNTTTEKAILKKKPIYCANATIRFNYGVVHTYFSVYFVLRLQPIANLSDLQNANQKDSCSAEPMECFLIGCPCFKFDASFMT